MEQAISLKFHLPRAETQESYQKNMHFQKPCIYFHISKRMAMSSLLYSDNFAFNQWIVSYENSKVLYGQKGKRRHWVVSKGLGTSAGHISKIVKD